MAELQSDDAYVSRPGGAAPLPRSLTSGYSRSGVLDWLTASDGRWLIVIISSAILLSGPMIAGYAVLDELALYLLLLPVIFVRLSCFRHISFPADRSRIQSVHRIVYVVFSLYMLIESIRGIFVLGDVRVFRFTALFAALALTAFFATAVSPSKASTFRIARIVVWSGIIYLLAYVVAGLIAEWLYQSWRFDLQGYYWSGTTAALFPVCVILPPILVVAAQGTKPALRLFWFGYVTLLVAGFYYQSRSVWIALMALLLAGSSTLGVRRLLIAVSIYAGFIIFFPWTEYLPLTPAQIVSSVSDKISGVFQGQSIRDANRFRRAVFGGIAGIPTELSEAPGDIALVTSIDELNKTLAEKQDLHRQIARNVRSTEDAARLATSEREIAHIEALLRQASQLRAKFMEEMAARHVDDIDRKLALIASGHYIINNGVPTLLFGTGYYTHRYKLLGVFEEVAVKYGYTFPASYKTIVRTATFNGMLVDTGIVGILLLGALFAFTGLSVVETAGLKGLLVPGPQLLSIVSLGLIALSLIVGATFDIVLLYLALMPYGAIMALYPSADAPIDA